MSGMHAIIIGGGYGGLALANLLAKTGYTVDVYEKNGAMGGRIAVTNQDGFVFETGPSWYLMPEIFNQYYELFGLNADHELDLLRLDPGYTVWYESHPPLVIRGDIAHDAAMFEGVVPGAGEALRRYVAKSTRAYRVATKYFLYSNFQAIRPFLRWEIVRESATLLALVFMTLDRYVSGAMRDPHLKQILEYHMVFLGSSPFQAPALYTLMSHLDFNSGVYYPRRGMFSLVDSLVAIGENLGVAYHVETEVKRILVEDETAVGVALANGTHCYADIVISNADLQFSETRLLSRAHQTYPESYWRRRQPGPGALLISLGVKGTLPMLTHHNLYFVDEWRDNFRAIYETLTIPEHASLYVCNPTKTDRSLAPKGHENLFILMPIPAGVTLDGSQTDALVTRTIATCAKIFGVPDLVSRIVTQQVRGPGDFAADFYAWQSNAFGGESHLLQQSVIWRTGNVSKKVARLYYVGAGSLPGIGLPMCLIGAAQTYKRIRNIRHDGPLSSQDMVTI